MIWRSKQAACCSQRDKRNQSADNWRNVAIALINQVLTRQHPPACRPQTRLCCARLNQRVILLLRSARQQHPHRVHADRGAERDIE